MVQFGFGRRPGQVVQMAYVVEDMGRSIAWWTDHLSVGPWFLLDSFLGDDHLYRGSPSTADVSIAMAFSGNMNIELIQPKDDNPSVYREIVQRRGFGFHHIGIAVTDVDAEIPSYRDKGHDVVFRAGVPSGGSVAYLDDGRNEPGLVELIPATPGMDDMFTRYWRASLDWDGKDPVRPFG